MGLFQAFQRALGPGLLLLPLVILGCRPAPPAPPAPASATGPAAAAEAPPAAPVPPAAPAVARPLPVLFAVARNGDAMVALAPETVTMPGPVPAFEVRAGAALPGARLVLLDSQDALVPGSGESEIGSESRFTFTPSQPLRPGATYLLRLEGRSGPGLSAADGVPYLPASFPVQVPGSAGRPYGGRRR
jgi:hypothetical protein